MIKGRENKGGAPSSDLLVCFPTRAHLTLMPKPICSPIRPSEPSKRHHHNPHLRRINTRASGPGSPLIWTKNNQIQGSSRGGRQQEDISEPTSPKVTCAGQIKVRPRASTTCRNWQTVMEEIERIHHRTKQKKKSATWAHALGFKKDVMNFLTCLRNIRFDFRCFGAFPEQVISSDDEEDDEDYEDVEEDDVFKEAKDDQNDDGTDKNAVFSKWFMVLQENHSKNNVMKLQEKEAKDEEEDDDIAPAAPPPNALLLMRCRSAPAKSWLEEKENEVENKEVNKQDIKEEKTVEVAGVMKEEKKKKKKRETLAIVMKYDTDFYKLSSDIAQETWVVGGFKEAFSRSRSWRK